jgi:haloacetate dehalogenase
MTYWPWILLSQKAPLPEKYLLGAPDAVFDNPFGQGSFGPEIKADYVETYRDPERVHAVCEEYRAAATLDIEHDKKDREESRRIMCPMLHLWLSADHSIPSMKRMVARWVSGGSGLTMYEDGP